jgi:integrase/recombinase XerD
LPWVEKQLPSKRTFSSYKSALGMLSPWLDGIMISQLTKKFIGRIAKERGKDGITNATLKRNLGALSSVCNFCVLHDMLDHNPVLPWLKSTKEHRDPIVLPRDEDIALVIKMAAKLNPESWGNWPYLIEVALVTGAREDELIRSQCADIDYMRETLTVIGKRNKRRAIDLKPFNGVAVLSKVPAFEGGPWLFWRTADKRVRNDSNRQPTFRGDRIEDPGPTFARITQAVAAWAKENGVEFRPFRFHDLRHKHAVDWLLAGRSIYTLQKRLGHTSVKTTEIYLDFLTDEEANVAKFGTAA